MKQTNIIQEVKEKEEVQPGNVYWSAREKGNLFLVLSPFMTKFGKKWDGVEFNLKPRYGEPHLSSGAVTTVAGDDAFAGYKETKLTAKMKKMIQKILKDPEDLERLDRAGTRVKDIERFIR